ncbi:hypothetical protein PGT21_023939 [Puccinia graminis f. sp. tritici]|uniref:Uncharacterized protein n=1 Tax=Puccinia graminis f. sp. tritici TaxID=56615 RepID=A0A5B0M3H7_PUCGR|nr:hypothetical protein PGT21_023939 [Puccinia graminis f. sp. tritici]KAA1125705.1 hypothetical protein PGTUg99_002573 [Puccinia graminis f. sp. tritici]
MRLLLIVAALIPFAYLLEPERQLQPDGKGFRKRASRDPIAIVKAPAKRKKRNTPNKPNKPNKPSEPNTSPINLGPGFLQRPHKDDTIYTLYSGADGYYTEMFN